jgi:hypothetical protein
MKVQEKIAEQVFAFLVAVLSLIYTEISQLSAQVLVPSS